MPRLHGKVVGSQTFSPVGDLAYFGDVVVLSNRLGGPLASSAKLVHLSD